MNDVITEDMLISGAAILVSDSGENEEYDRGMVELIALITGKSPEAIAESINKRK